MSRLVGGVARKGRQVADTAGALLGSEESEWRLGMACVDELVGQYGPVPDPHLLERVGRVFNRVAPARKEGCPPFRVHLIDAPFVNAFAVPGRHVILSRPIVDLCAESEAQLAFVICHEIAHGLKKHWKSKMATDFAAGTMLSVVTRGQLTDLAKKLIGQLISNGYSRSLELEADRLAVVMMATAGFDPHDGIRVLGKMVSVPERSPLEEYLSTHPPKEERVKESLKALR